jgi:tetratricopeptide (TPR) repeat protein
MGLWVMGTEWLDIVNEVAVDLENIDDNEKDPLKWEAAGLAHVILGDGKNALDDFEHAGNLGDKAQSLAGSAVAWVILGDESKAIEILKEEIALNPSDQLARENLKWLTMPSSVAPAKK